MRTSSCLVIGAGAAGMTAAISRRRQGKDVLLVERLSKPGKKILASGGGRCNLLNEHLDPAMYNEASRGLVAAVFAVFGKEKLRAFLEGLGLEITADGDRLFPATNQSASVVRAFELEIVRRNIPIEYNFEATTVVKEGNRFIVLTSSGARIECAQVIVAGGGRSYPSLGSNGSCYRLAKSLGHRIIEPVPACVALCVKDKMCHNLQGQRITANASCIVDGAIRASSGGELLFTQYGLSGTAVLDISTQVALALYRQKKKHVEVAVDLVPFLDAAALTRKLEERLASKWDGEDVLTGILPNKFSCALSDLLRSGNPAKISRVLKDRRFTVTDTRGWNEAEFTSGGVDTQEVDHASLCSKRIPGLYFCGEVLDVDGRRGGYNLAWAWASGLLAGRSSCTIPKEGGANAL